jgi:hypothetical protein
MNANTNTRQMRIGDLRIEYPVGSAAIVRAIVRAADEGGTISARDALRLMPHERPELHTEMCVEQGLAVYDAKVID